MCKKDHHIDECVRSKYEVLKQVGKYVLLIHLC